MKRGRPTIRDKVQSCIISILSSSLVPLTVASIARLASEALGKTISWNTVHKYLQELVQTNKAQTLVLPHSKDKNKNGLTMYILKK